MDNKFIPNIIFEPFSSPNIEVFLRVLDENNFLWGGFEPLVRFDGSIYVPFSKENFADEENGVVGFEISSDQNLYWFDASEEDLDDLEKGFLDAKTLGILFCNIDEYLNFIKLNDNPNEFKSDCLASLI